MKVKSDLLEGDGFDKNVAEKMPRMKKLEEPIHSVGEREPEISEKKEIIDTEKGPISEASKKDTSFEYKNDLTRLIEDLHTQLFLSAQTKRALETDLKSYEKTIQKLTQENQNLRKQIVDLNEEINKLRKIQTELIYLKEENSDAQERIQKFQQEMKELKDLLDQTIKQRDDALNRIYELESKLESEEVLKIKGRLKERELIFLSEENQRLQSRLEEALARNIDLEEKYNSLRKSFNEVKESLTLLRDSCKRDFYNLTEEKNY